jgi:hypothetical protein
MEAALSAGSGFRAAGLRYSRISFLSETISIGFNKDYVSL